MKEVVVVCPIPWAMQERGLSWGFPEVALVMVVDFAHSVHWRYLTKTR
jgi:hypothetical protein